MLKLGGLRIWILWLKSLLGRVAPQRGLCLNPLSLGMCQAKGVKVADELT